VASAVLAMSALLVAVNTSTAHVVPAAHPVASAQVLSYAKSHGFTVDRSVRARDGVEMIGNQGGNCSSGHDQYYWVSALSTLPLFVSNDFPVLFATAKEFNVCAHVVGPAAFDLAGDVAAIEEVCAKHPTGVMVVGLDASLGSAIDKCIAERVPTVTIDVDVPGSDRLSFVGGNFTSLGTFIADNMIGEQKRLKHRTTGEIAMTMDTTVPSNAQIEAGIETELKAKGWTFDGVQNDMDTAAGGLSASSALITAHQKLDGIISIGSEPGPGTVEAVRESGKGSQIIVTAGQNDTAFAQDIKKGTLAAFFGPKRVNIDQFGLITLYQFVHPVGLVSGLNKWQFPPIPPFVDVGAYAVDSTNVNAWLKAQG
jgi:ribose transport system substrate-binding protein